MLPVITGPAILLTASPCGSQPNCPLTIPEILHGMFALSVTKAYIVDYNTAVPYRHHKNSIRRTGSTHIRIAQCRTACCSYRCLLYRIHLSGSTISPCHRICLSRTPAVLCPPDGIHTCSCRLQHSYVLPQYSHDTPPVRIPEDRNHRGTVVCSSPPFSSRYSTTKNSEDDNDCL